MPAGPQAEIASGVASENTRVSGMEAQLADLGFFRVDAHAQDLPKEHRARESGAERGRSRVRGGGSVHRSTRHELRDRTPERRGRDHTRRQDATKRQGMVMPNDDNTIASSWYDVGKNDDHMASGLSSLKGGQAHRQGPNFHPQRTAPPPPKSSRNFEKIFKSSENNLAPKLTGRFAPPAPAPAPAPVSAAGSAPASTAASAETKSAATTLLSLKHSKYAPDELKNEAKDDRRKMVALQKKHGEETAAADALERAQTSLVRFKDAAARIEKGIEDFRGAEEAQKEKKKTELAVLVSENWLDLLEMQKDAQEKLASLPTLAGSKWAS